jgi:hypothetical protein
LPDSSLGVGFVDHVDGLEMFGFRKVFRGLDRSQRLLQGMAKPSIALCYIDA